MRKWLFLGLIAVALVLVVGLVLAFIPKLREKSDLVRCQNNLREIGLFAAFHVDPAAALQGNQPRRIDPAKLLHEIPPGTIVLAGVPPENRLSWVVGVLPGLDQRRQDTAGIVAAIDARSPWDAERNQHAAGTRLLTLLCPGNPAMVGSNESSPTQYVGIAGVGTDAAGLALPLPPATASPRAGCFRSDAPTPFDAVADGLSQTLLFGERSTDLGPWLRGGPATVRGLDDAQGAKPLIGVEAQFGGNHRGTSVWGFADGSARFIGERVDAKVMYGLATIAGKESDPLPGE